MCDKKDSQTNQQEEKIIKYIQSNLKRKISYDYFN